MGFLGDIFTGLGFGFGSGVGHKVAEEVIDVVTNKGEADASKPVSATPAQSQVVEENKE